MKIDLIPIKKFIIGNKLEEVSESILFDKGFVPTPGGLLSTDIFGVSVRDRRDTFAYINLYGHFLTPFIFKLLRRMNRNFENIINGTKHFIIDETGKLVENDETGHTGIEWLYQNWNKINFEKNESLIRNERIDVLNAYDRDTIFTEYWAVLPAFFRDVNLQSARQGIISHHEVNDKYSKLIRLVSVLKNENNFDFVLNTTRSKVQETLVEIYDFFKGEIEKKQGLIRRSLLGKSIDYGARSVISAPVFKANKPEEMNIDFYHCGIPLAQCCSLFTPFIVSGVKRFFQVQLEKIGNKFPVLKDGKMFYVKLKDPALYFNEEYIKKQIDKFVHSPADRFETIELPIDEKSILPEGVSKVYLTFSGKKYHSNNDVETSPLINRRATWTDILYQVAADVTADLMVFVTRYPIIDYFGTFPNQITVLSTHDTEPIYINNKVYPNYPKINFDIPKEQLSVLFADTITMSNLYLNGLGGNYKCSRHLLSNKITLKSHERLTNGFTLKKVS